MTWQPIDSAPKDGTRFLAYWPVAGINVCEWMAPAGFTEHFTWAGHMTPMDPTHWMPLPNIPVTNAEEPLI